MDNATPVQTPLPSQISQPVVPPKSSKKKIIILVSIPVVILIVVLLLVYFLTKNNTKLVIDGTEIPAQEINLIEDFYEREGSEDKGTTAKFVADLYAENTVLKNALEENSIEFSSLSSEIADLKNITAATRDYPERLNTLLAENTVMKAHLIPLLGIKSRTGEIIQLEVPVEKQTSTPNKDYAQLMQSKLALYQQLVEGGISWENVKQRIQDDPQLQPDPDITMRIFAFEEMTPMRPAFLNLAFVDTVFSTDIDHSSEVFDVSGKDTITFGIAYVIAASGGEFMDYQAWLENEKKSIKIEDNS
jgi:hypothetical protein